MAKRVIWSARAKRDFIAIYAFWLKRTGSHRYSLKLRKAFKKATEHLKEQSLLGKVTDTTYFRFVVVGYYKLFYAVVDDTIVILSIFDTRQDPDKAPY